MTPTRKNPKTGSTKEVILRNGYRPTVRTVKGQDYKPNMNWEEKVIYYRTMWANNPDLYSSRPEGTFNHELSPNEFFSHFLSPDDIKLDTSSDKSTWITKIANSFLNRFPSTKGEFFMTRMGYAFCCVAGISDSNSFPMTLQDTSDEPEKIFPYLMLKDRGNWSYLVSLGNVKILTVAQWKSILKNLEFQKDYMELKLKNKRFKKILSDSKAKLNSFSVKEAKVKKLSLKEVIGRNVWDEWYYCDRAINIRVNFETLGVHTNEMQAFNNTETKWVLENFLLSELNLVGFYNIDEYAIDDLPKIHALCVNDDVFSGSSLLLARLRNKAQEGFESWYPIGITAYLHSSWDSFINFVSSKRMSDERKQTWRNLFSNKDDNDNFTVIKKVTEVINLIKHFDKLPQVDEYETELSYQLENDSKLDGNVSKDRMSLEHPDNVAILLKAAYDLSKKVFKGRGDSYANRKTVLKKLLTNLVKIVKRGDLVKLCGRKTKRTTKSRYNNFWKPLVIKETEKELLSNKPSWDAGEFWSLLKSKITWHVNIFEGKILDVYDKDSDGVWIKHEINFDDRTGLHGCHINPSAEETISNMFLHLSGYNKDWGRKTISDLESFMNKVDGELHDYAKENNLRNFNGRNNQAFYYNTQMLNKAVLEVFNDINV